MALMCVCVVGGIGANISAMLRNRALSYLHRSVLLRILVEDDNSLLYETQVGHNSQPARMRSWRPFYFCRNVAMRALST